MGQDRFDKGLALRKQVLGADYVEKSMASADDFSRPMQELSTEYCPRRNPRGAVAGGGVLRRARRHRQHAHRP